MQDFGISWVIWIENSKFAIVMKKMNGAAIALMMATAMTVGCSTSNEDDPKPVIDPVEPPATFKLTRAEQEMVSSSNDFAFNLFREAQEPKKSLILSPISITYALGMLNNGAAGETQQQINKVLGFSETGADGINDFCYKMLQRAATLDEQTKVLIADNIYMNKGYELLPEFKSKAKTFYDADAETRDFNDGKTRDVINQWGSDHTEGMIKEVLKEEEFNPDFVSYLLNAIYFKGTWQYKFDKELTTKELFLTSDILSEAVEVPMMHQTAEFEYAETDEYKALRLPYGNGSFLLTVILPKVAASGNEEPLVMDVSSIETWQQVNQKMSATHVDVALPRFESDTDIDLIPIMEKLGMTRAFMPAAEFPNFCNTETYIRLMKQVAKIKLDEEGTEAAAVTVIGMDKGEPVYQKFHANHPFLYVISEKETGAIFFIGQYTGY